MTAFADRLPGSLRGAVVPRWLPAVLGALAWPAGAVLLPNGAPAGVVLIGAILGSASALTAVGLVLVWRSARLVNCAVAAMGAATGLSAIRLHTAWGWPYPVALAIGVIAGTVTGVVVEFHVPPMPTCLLIEASIDTIVRSRSFWPMRRDTAPRTASEGIGRSW